MPRYNVQREDGQWACFSDTIAFWITDFMPRDKYEAWRQREYGIYGEPLEECNRMTVEEAEELIRERRTFYESSQDRG